MSKMNIENNLKGAMAEQLTKELFFDAGYEVFYYGVEHLVPGFLSRTEYKERDREHPTNNVIRSLPDFLVLKDGKSYYVEAKFRMDGRLDLEKHYPFLDARVIIFSKDNIYVGIAGEVINEEAQYKPIDEYNPFGFCTKTIEACKSLLKKYFLNLVLEEERKSQEKVNKLLDAR